MSRLSVPSVQWNFVVDMVGLEIDLFQTAFPENPAFANEQGPHLARMDDVEDDCDYPDKRCVEDVEEHLGLCNLATVTLQIRRRPEDASTEDETAGDVKGDQVLLPWVCRVSRSVRGMLQDSPMENEGACDEGSKRSNLNKQSSVDDLLAASDGIGIC